MHRQKTPPIKLALLAAISLIGLVFLLVKTSPVSPLPLGPFDLSLLLVFFPLLFLVVFSVTSLITQSKKHGVLFGLFVVSYLLLRLNGLTHIFFLAILAALFLCLEVFFLSH